MMDKKVRRRKRKYIKKPTKKPTKPILNDSNTFKIPRQTVVSQYEDEGREVVGWNYFDTLTIDNSNFKECMSMFVSPIGSYDIHGRVKTECDTNMYMNGVLPAPTEMSIFAFRVEKVLDTPDTDRYIRNGVMEFWVGQKMYYQCPLSHVNTMCNYISLEILYNSYFTIRINCGKFDVENLIKLRVYIQGRIKRGVS